MDKYKKKWTILEQDVFDLLSKRAGEKLSQREIAKAINASPTAVGNAIRSLGEIFKTEKAKTINFITFNRDSKRAVELKRAHNLKTIIECGFVDQLEEKLPGATIILFGSYSWGMDTSRSDIDIAIIGRKETAIDPQRYEKELQRTINLSFYGSLKDVAPHLRNNILSGIVLSGGIEL